MDVARLRIDHGTDAAAQRKDGTTPLRLASQRRVGPGLGRLLTKRGGADATARSKDTVWGGHMDLAWPSLGHGVDAVLMPQI